MKDQFRSRRVALWLNLIPDLVRSGELEAAAKMEDLGDEERLEEEYLTYSETLPLIPSIKDISLSKTKLQVSSQASQGPEDQSISGSLSLVGWNK